MKNGQHRKEDDYEIFYMELPHADYMEDIEIQDEYDNPSYDTLQGLSDIQVSEIAKDSLAAAEQHDQSHTPLADPASDAND